MAPLLYQDHIEMNQERTLWSEKPWSLQYVYLQSPVWVQASRVHCMSMSLACACLQTFRLCPWPRVCDMNALGFTSTYSQWHKYSPGC